MRFWKCEFWEKWDFEIVNFVKNVILKMWILWKMRVWNCKFCENWDFQNVNFWINWGFLPQCESLIINSSWRENSKSPFSPYFLQDFPPLCFCCRTNISVSRKLNRWRRRVISFLWLCWGLQKERYFLCFNAKFLLYYRFNQRFFSRFGETSSATILVNVTELS